MYPLTVAIVIGTRQLSEEARPVLQSLGCRVALDQVFTRIGLGTL